MHMGFCCMYVWISYECLVLGPEESIGCPETGVMDSYKQGPLEEQPMFLTRSPTHRLTFDIWKIFLTFSIGL